MTVFDDIVESLHGLLDLHVSHVVHICLIDILGCRCRNDDTAHQRFPGGRTYLENIDVISLQSLAAIFDSSKYPLSCQIVLDIRGRNTHLSTEPGIIDKSGWTVCLCISPLEEGLGHDYHALPWDLVFLDEFTQDPFGVALRVGVGCIEGLGVNDSA
jgi:hypothetical protein